MTRDMTLNLLDANHRNDHITRQIDRLRVPGADPDAVRQDFQALIENATSIRLGDKDRAALRVYLSRVIRHLGDGNIDERTAKVDLNKVIMAAAANSPDVLGLIHIEA